MVEAALRMGQAAKVAAETATEIDYENGTYKGDVMNGLPHGLGVWRNSDETLDYEGEWLNGLRNGLGIERYSGGTVKYAGEWLDTASLLGGRSGLGVVWTAHAGWWVNNTDSRTAPDPYPPV
eukprot:GHVU01070989.1.p1 GENE.GHVU01070989.1~~GHVU01070989.1.p1  ORF type:complete len:139 (+),score=18.19 GHVU01070989.1:53-418(+)